MESHLHWADYLILAGFLAISLGIGIYHSLTGGRQRTIAEFIMGNRRLKVIPTAVSFFVSFQSAIFLLGHTAEIYTYGIQFVIFALVTHIIVYFIVKHIIVPWLYPLKLVSIYEYFEKRYLSKILRISGSVAGILVVVLFTGAAIYAPSAALESVPVMTAVSVAYTVLGGMRAVIWTDVFQFLIMLGGIIAILVKGLIVVGGMRNVFRLADEEGRLVWANVSFDPRERHTVWNILIGVGINLTATYGLSQMALQRFCAVNKLSKAKIMVLLNIPPTTIMFAMTAIIGLIIVAYYSSIKCDPLANKDIANPNMLLPYFVVTIFADSPGFSGLFLSTLYGASLSTVSSALSGSAANCWEDMLKWKLNYLPETKKVFINRLLVVLFGAIATGVAFLAASVERPIIQVLIAFSSSLVGPLASIIILGAVSKHANWKGSLLGGMVGFLITLWLLMGSLSARKIHAPLPPVSMERCSSRSSNSTLFHSSMNYPIYASGRVFDGNNSSDKNYWNQTESPSHVNSLRGMENVYAMSYLWFLPIAVVVTAVVGITASLIMRDRDLEAKVDERLLMRFYGCRRSDQDENQEQLDNLNGTSPQEAKDLKELDDGGEIDELEESENQFC